MKAFLGGFFSAGVLMLLLAAEPPGRPPVGQSNTRPDVTRPVQAGIQGRADTSTGQSTRPLNMCNQRLAASIGAFGLRFDHLSEQLKAESRQLVFSIIEISADCPEANLGILKPAREVPNDLSMRRQNALIEGFRRGGLTAAPMPDLTASTASNEWELLFFIPQASAD